ncbi:MAG: protein kinase domain-containing protein [Planctomycetota bacterium]|jgi:pSer/pThr/pTyr-binding forkhead associated (FHA) protein/TolA-binding protein
MAKLVLLTEYGTETFNITDDTKLGRSSKCLISIKDKKISREHARLFTEGDTFFIEDLGSSNGTFVNGEKKDKSELNDGDRIRTGKSELIFNDDENDPLAGKMLQGYQINLRLGQGSMGSVYLANQLSMERNVAIKVLKKELAQDDEFVKRFEDEAKLAGKLNHKNVIGAHDFGFAEGRYFFSMEFVKGDNLQQIIDRKGSVDPQKCIDYSLQVARGLEHAHKLGIIHQDIKPLNIIINEADVVKIADLGLAKNMKLLDPTDKNNMKIMGTPQYIAPEVLKKKIPDNKSDIYSLGATIFHMATGSPCFTGSDVMDVVKQRLDSPTPDPKGINSKIPLQLSEAILKLMEINPENRPQDISEVIALLESVDLKAAAGTAGSVKPAAVAAAAPSSTETPSVRKRAPKNPQSAAEKKKNKRMAMLIVYLISVGLAGVLAVIIYQFLKPDPEKEAEKNYRQAQQYIEAGKDNEALDYLEYSLAEYPRAKVNSDINNLIGVIKRKHKLNTFAQQYKNGNLSSLDMRRVLLKFIGDEKDPHLLKKAKSLLAVIPESDEEESAEDTDASDNTAADERANPEWVSTRRSVNTRITAGDLKTAQNLLNDFIGKYPGADEIPQARTMLDNIYEQIENKFNKKLTDIKELYKDDDTASWQELEKLLFETSGPAQREKVHNEMSKLAAKFRAPFRRLQIEISKAVLSLETAEALKLARALETRHSASSWGSTAVNHQENLNLSSKYAFALQRKISAGTIGKLSVPGIKGEKSITLSPANKPAVKVNNEYRDINWGQLFDNDLWNISQADSLTDEQKAGAALHFAARKHMGYAKTFIKKIRSPSPAVAFAQEEINAALQGRSVIESINFTSYSDAKRWKQLAGVCNFDNGWLDCSGQDTFTASLTGRLFNLKNSSIKIKVKRNKPQGTFKLKMNCYGKNSLSILLTEENSSLYYQDSENPDKSGDASGKSLGAETEIQLVVKSGKAVLLSGSDTICTLDTGANGNLFYRMVIGFEKVSGKIGRLVVSEGR